MRKRRDEADALQKWSFYFIALIPLFFLMLLLSIDMDLSQVFPGTDAFTEAHPIGSRCVLPGIFLVFIVFGFILVTRKLWKWSGADEVPRDIIALECRNYDFLSYLCTYALPLIGIEIGTGLFHLIAFFVVVFLQGAFFILTDAVYSSPTLALFGYRLYQAKVKANGKIVEATLLSKNRLALGTPITWRPLDENVWIVRRA